MTACLILIRHAQASFDDDNYDRLSVQGERQARSLAGWWRDSGLRARYLLGGGLERHARTAAPLLQACGGVLVTEPGLREFDHREIFYRQRPDLLDPAALAAWKAEYDYPGRFELTWRAALARWMDPRHGADYQEAWPAFRSRCLAAVAERLAALDDGEVALAFTSSGPMAVLLQACWGGDDASFVAVQGALFNTGMTECWRDPAARGPGRPGQVNACPHLPPALRTRR